MLKGDSEPVREVSGPFYGFVRWRDLSLGWGNQENPVTLKGKQKSCSNRVRETVKFPRAKQNVHL